MASFSDRLEMLILANGSQAQREFDKTSKSAQKGLGAATDSASKFKLGLLAVGGGAVAAGLAVGKLALDAANDFEDWGKTVLKVMRLTGDSATDASHLAFAFQQTGVDADAGARAIGIFSKKVEASKDPMKDFGIQTHTASGQVKPMNDLLLEMAQRVSKMPDGIAKTALVLKTFGKNGAQLLPFLDRGAAGLYALAKQADHYGLTLDQKDIQATKDAITAHRNLNASLQGLAIAFGRVVLPAITDTTNALTGWLGDVRELSGGGAQDVFAAGLAKAAAENWGQFSKALSDNQTLAKQWATTAQHDLNPAAAVTETAAANAVDSYVKWQKGAQTAAIAISGAYGVTKTAALQWLVTQAQQGTKFKTAEDALAGYKTSVDKAATGQQSLAYQTSRATQAMDEQHNRITGFLDPIVGFGQALADDKTAQDNFNQAVRDSGRNSPAAAQASLALIQSAESTQTALFNVKKELLAHPDAALQAQRALDTLRNQGFIPAGSAADTAANQVQGLINKVLHTPGEHTTDMILDDRQALADLDQLYQEFSKLPPTIFGTIKLQPTGNGGRFAQGTGNLPEGWSQVGEHGPEIIRRSGSQVQVLPHGRQPADAGGVMTAPQPIQLVVDGRVLAEVIYPHSRAYERSHR